MSSGVEVEIFVGILVSAFSIIGGTALNGWAKRQEEQRAAERERQEQQRKSTGERIGRLERYVDFQRGRQAGLREARRSRRGSNDE